LRQNDKSPESEDLIQVVWLVLEGVQRKTAHGSAVLTFNSADEDVPKRKAQQGSEKYGSGYDAR
jgi:hypothetical protein